MPDEKNNQRKSFMRLFSLIMNIGITTTACVLIGIGLGILLDRLLGTSPWLLIILTLLGISAAFKNIYDLSKKF